MYLIRLTSGRPAKMRDGAGMKSPMKEVSQDRFTLFKNLPAGVSPQGGQGLEVKAVASDAEAKSFEAAQGKSLKAEAEARAAYAARVKAKMDRIKAEAAAKAKALEAKPKERPNPSEKAKLSHTDPELGVEPAKG